MPTSAVSPLMRIHSWSFVYFKSDGYAMALRSFVERQWDDACGRGPSTYVDGEIGPWRGEFGRNIGQADRLLQERGLSAAGDDADSLVTGNHCIAVARDAAVDHFEADQLARDALLLLLAQAI